MVSSDFKMHNIISHIHRIAKEYFSKVKIVHLMFYLYSQLKQWTEELTDNWCNGCTVSVYMRMLVILNLSSLFCLLMIIKCFFHQSVEMQSYTLLKTAFESSKDRSTSRANRIYRNLVQHALKACILETDVFSYANSIVDYGSSVIYQPFVKICPKVVISSAHKDYQLHNQRCCF